MTQDETNAANVRAAIKPLVEALVSIAENAKKDGLEFSLNFSDSKQQYLSVVKRL